MGLQLANDVVQGSVSFGRRRTQAIGAVVEPNARPDGWAEVADIG